MKKYRWKKKREGGGDKEKAVCGKKLVSDGGWEKVQKMAIISLKKAILISFEMRMW